MLTERKQMQKCKNWSKSKFKAKKTLKRANKDTAFYIVKRSTPPRQYVMNLLRRDSVTSGLSNPNLGR